MFFLGMICASLIAGFISNKIQPNWEKEKLDSPFWWMIAWPWFMVYLCIKQKGGDKHE